MAISSKDWKPKIISAFRKGDCHDVVVQNNPFYDYIDSVTRAAIKTRELQGKCLSTLEQISLRNNDETKNLMLFQQFVCQIKDCGPLGNSVISYLEENFGSSNPEHAITNLTHLECLKELMLGIKIYPGHLGDYNTTDGPAPSLERGMVSHAKKSCYASTKGLAELKQQVCQTYEEQFGLKNLSPDNVWVSPGESFAMWLTLQSMIAPGQKVGFLRPMYPKNLDWIKDAGGIAVPFDIGYPVKFDKIALRVYFESEQPAVMIWTDPHNPTGFCLSDEDQRDLLSLSAEFGVRLLVDAAYEFVRYDETRDEYGQISSMLRYADYYDPQLTEHIVHCMTIGKGWRGNGYRIGIMVGEAGLVQNVSAKSGSIIGSVSTPMQYAALEALKCLNDAFCNTELLRQKRDIIALILKDTTLEFEVPKGTFYYFFCVTQVLQGSNLETADGFCKACMAETGIAMIPGSFYGFQDGVRLSFAGLTMEDVDKSMVKLKIWMDALSTDLPL